MDQCDVMLKLLQPSQEPIQEIDYLLVIKMLKYKFCQEKLNYAIICVNILDPLLLLPK